MDTAISHHHNAGSLTRFDTDNRDFDQRLAQVLHSGEEEFPQSFWTHQDSLNRWTLKFNENDIEQEYRQHFVESGHDSHNPTVVVMKPGVANHEKLKKGSPTPKSLDAGEDTIGARSAADSMEQQLLKQSRYRYSGKV